MIELRVMDYCHDCPDFEAHTDKACHKYLDGHTNELTIVRCEYADRCRTMFDYLGKHIDSRRNGDGQPGF